MPAITSSDDGFLRTINALKLLFGLTPESEQPFMWHSQLGFHGYNISVFQSHVDYLNALNSVITPDLPRFDANAIERWKLINELLLASFASTSFDTNQITRNWPNLAALVAFPTLEEIARCISKLWDEEGVMLQAVLTTDGVAKWKEDGTSIPMSFTVGQQISNLSYKLQLMSLSLDPRLRSTIASLDAVLRCPMIEGIEQPMSPLYDRLKFFRDQWAHGRRFEGWEALLISLLIALIYFGSLKFRNPSI